VLQRLDALVTVVTQVRRRLGKAAGMLRQGRAHSHS
jgi:hypothetical protein